MIWDEKNYTLLQKFISKGAANYVAFNDRLSELGFVTDVGEIGFVNFGNNSVKFYESGTDKSIWTIAINPDGTKYLTGGSNKQATLWDYTTKQVIFNLSGHNGPVWSVKFSPDGRYIVTGSADKTAKLWDSTSGTLLKTFSGHTGEIRGVDLSPDGHILATASLDGSVRLWDTISGNEILKITKQSGAVYSAAFSHNGKYLVTSSADKIARIWPIYFLNSPNSESVWKTISSGRNKTYLNAFINSFPDSIHLSDAKRILEDLK